MCTSFLIICYIDIPSYTDDSTAYVVKDDWIIIESLAIDYMQLLNCFNGFLITKWKSIPINATRKQTNVGKYPIKTANAKNYSVWKYVIN